MTLDPATLAQMARGGAIAFLIAVEALLAVVALYLLVLTGASFLRRRLPQGAEAGRRRFAVLIPAHNEELLLGALVRSLQGLDYPAALFDIHVVADNCTDATPSVGREAGAQVHERFAPASPGKAYALNWLIERLLTSGVAYDAFVVLDADSIVSPNFLSEMDAQLRAGARAVQSFNDVANPAESWTASLRYIAFCLICYLRPLGRSGLGVSVGLCGNGMCLSRVVVERFRWDPAAPSEDHEFNLRLLAAGIRVAFAPEAHVYSQMPNSLGAARSQNVRWERGKLELMRRHSPRLLLDGARTGDWSKIDGALALLVPPFSLTFGLAFATLGASLVSGSTPAIGLATFNVLALLLHSARGLAIMPVRSPRIYLALLYAPWFILWKVGVYLAVAAGAGKGQWVRTARTHAP